MLVALAVGILLFAGLGQVFMTTKRTSITQEESGMLQENSRYAAYLLAREIHHAGFLGCGTAANLKVHSSGTYGDNFSMAVSGYEAVGTAPGESYALGEGGGTWSPALPAELSGAQIMAGSDVIVLHRAAGIGLRFSSQTDSGFVIADPREKTSQGCSATQDSYYGLCPGDVALVSDCVSARSFTIDSLALNGDGDLEIRHNQGWGGANDPDINNRYNEDFARLYSGYTISFFVREGPNDIPSLYRLVSGPSANAEPLIEGVENMQILFGIDSDGDGSVNQYLPAGPGLDFSKVISVRIALLLRSVRDIPNRKPPNSPPAWNLAGTEIVTKADRLLRKSFSTTVQLRDQGR